MRYLTVVRHAKSAPAKPGESDFVRPLNKRGRDECERLREWASDPAAIVAYLTTGDPDLNTTRDIALAAIDPVTTSLLVVGHNPTVHEVMITLAKDLPKALRGDHYPLGGAFVLALPDDRPVGLARYEVVASYIPV